MDKNTGIKFLFFQGCQVPQALLGGIRVQGDEKPCAPLFDKKGYRGAVANSTIFMGNGEYAHERDEEPPSQCKRLPKTEAGT